MNDERKGYITSVPVHHDRVVWRGRYYGLPILPHANALSEVDRLAELGWILAMRALQSDLVMDDAEIGARDHFIWLHNEKVRKEAGK